MSLWKFVITIKNNALWEEDSTINIMVPPKEEPKKHPKISAMNDVSSKNMMVISMERLK
jgi:hypothetical protein